jgi:uncharacterized membrane protein (DUF106 family)
MDILKVIAAFVNAEQLGGWVRALVATILGAASGWFGGALVPFLTPEFQAAVGVVVATVVVGVWSTVAKKIQAS